MTNQETQQVMVSLHVLSHCHEIQNFHRCLWMKAPFSKAPATGRAQLSGRKECLLHARVLLASVSILVEKTHRSQRQLSSLPGIQMIREGTLHPELRSWGHPSSLPCTQRPESRPTTCPPSPHGLGDSVRGQQRGADTGGAGQVSVSTYPGFPLSCSMVSGAPVTFTPSL